jgi:hypothetical protein
LSGLRRGCRRAIVGVMRRIAIALVLVSAASCSKKSDKNKEQPKPVPETGSGSAGSAAPVPLPPMPGLAKDPGDASGEPAWVVGIGGQATDTVRGVAVDPDGSTYVAGYFEGEATFGALGTKTPTPPKDHDPKGPVPKKLDPDAFVMKIDSTGKPAWVQTWGGGRADVALAVAAGKDGLAVAGNFLDELKIAGMAAKSTNSDDFYVLGVDRKGQPSWLLTGGGTDSDGLNAIAATPDGGWIAGGSFADVAEIHDSTHVEKIKSVGQTDAFLMKLSSTGDVEWVKSFGGPAEDTIFRIAVDAQGGIFVLGTFVYESTWGGEKFKAAGNSDTDIVLAKYDANGAHQWSKRFGDTMNDVAGGLAVDPAGNVTFTGSYDQRIRIGEVEYEAHGESDVIVAKFTNGGDPIWAKSWGADREDVGYGVVADASGNLVVTGWFINKVDFGMGPAKMLEAPNLNKDVFVVKLAPDGNTIWQRSFGDKDHDQARAIAIDGEGNPVVAGIFRFALSLAPLPAIESVRKPDEKAPHGDVFVARFKR